MASVEGQGVDLLVAAEVLSSSTPGTKPAELSTGDDALALSVGLMSNIAQHRHRAGDKLKTMTAQPSEFVGKAVARRRRTFEVRRPTQAKSTVILITQNLKKSHGDERFQGRRKGSLEQCSRGSFGHRQEEVDGTDRY